MAHNPVNQISDGVGFLNVASFFDGLFYRRLLLSQKVKFGLNLLPPCHEIRGGGCGFNLSTQPADLFVVSVDDKPILVLHRQQIQREPLSFIHLRLYRRLVLLHVFLDHLAVKFQIVAIRGDDGIPPLHRVNVIVKDDLNSADVIDAFLEPAFEETFDFQHDVIEVKFLHPFVSRQPFQQFVAFDGFAKRVKPMADSFQILPDEPLGFLERQVFVFVSRQLHLEVFALAVASNIFLARRSP